MLAIAARELRSLFVSPLAWTILAVSQVILGYLFLAGVDRFERFEPRLAQMDSAPGVTDIVVAPLFGNATVILLLVIPLITMRLISEERRSGTLTLLLSAPVSMTRIVLGKYLGVLGFLGLLALLVVIMPLALVPATELDWGKLAAALLGLVLSIAAFAAAGLFMSTLTSHPTAAAIATFGLLLLLWLLDWAGNMGATASAALSYLSLMKHFQSLSQGMFNSADVAYFLLFIGTFLGLAIRRLDAERLQG